MRKQLTADHRVGWGPLEHMIKFLHSSTWSSQNLVKSTSTSLLTFRIVSWENVLFKYRSECKKWSSQVNEFKMYCAVDEFLEIDGEEIRNTGVSPHWGCLYYNWGILSRNPGQSHIPAPISVYHGVVQADFACLGGVGWNKNWGTPQLKICLKNSYKIVSCLAHRKLWKGGFLTGPPQSGETSPNRVKQVRVNIKISDLSPKHYSNLGKQGNPNS